MEGIRGCQCPACGAEFATREELEEHNRQAHQGMQAQEQGGSYPCEACGATFGTGEELEAHARDEHGR
jgi:hypothetical protein